MNTTEFINSLKQDLGPGVAGLAATLTVAGQPPCIGKFYLESVRCGQGTFQPTDESSLDKYPSNGAVLLLTEKSERLRVSNFRRCTTPAMHHYHFDFEVIG